MKQNFTDFAEDKTQKLIYFLENFELPENKAEWLFLWWGIKNKTPLIYWLWHIPFIRNKYRRITWHHYLGCHYSKAWKWL